MYKVILKEESTGGSEDHDGYYGDVVIFDNIPKEDFLSWLRTKEAEWGMGEHWEENLPPNNPHTMLWLDYYPEPFDEQRLEYLHNGSLKKVRVARFAIAHDIYEGEKVVEESADLWEYNLVIELAEKVV